MSRGQDCRTTAPARAASRVTCLRGFHTRNPFTKPCHSRTFRSPEQSFLSLILARSLRAGERGLLVGAAGRRAWRGCRRDGCRGCSYYPGHRGDGDNDDRPLERHARRLQGDAQHAIVRDRGVVVRGPRARQGSWSQCGSGGGGNPRWPQRLRRRRGSGRGASSLSTGCRRTAGRRTGHPRARGGRGRSRPGRGRRDGRGRSSRPCDGARRGRVRDGRRRCPRRGRGDSRCAGREGGGRGWRRYRRRSCRPHG